MTTKKNYPGCQIPVLSELYAQYLPEKGKLVEVGAYDGLSYSNTIQLLTQGWEGLYIEPVPQFAAECARNLEGYAARVVCAACGNFIGQSSILVREEYSTILPEVDVFSESLNWTPDRTGRRIVEVTTLDSLLTDAQLDLLVVDVEGYEKEVLQGFTLLETILPKMIIIELHETSQLWQPLPGFRETIEYVYGRLSMYYPVYVDEINTVFVRI